MRVGCDNLVGLKSHGIFDTGAIFQRHQNLLTQGSVRTTITRVVSLPTVWYKMFMKLGVTFIFYFAGKRLSHIFHWIDAYLDVIVKVIEVKISVSFQLGTEEDLAEFWVTDIIFQRPNTTNFLRFPTFYLWKFPFGVYHGGRILRLVCFYLV